MSDEQKGAASHRLENSGRLGMAQEHEILTSTGWQPVGHLTIYDKVYTLNTKTGEIELYYPDRILSHEHQGYMYQIQSQMVSQLVAENHMFYASKRARKNLKDIWIWRSYKVKDLAGKRFKLKRNGIWIGTETEYFTLPSYGVNYKMDDWLEFLGYYIADGSSSTGRFANYQINVSKSLKVNPILYQKICKCLERMGFRISKVFDRIQFSDKTLNRYLRNLGVARQKYIPQALFDLPERQLRILFRALMACDGHYHKKYGTPICYYTTSKQLADDFQRLLFLIGLSGNISLIPSKTVQRNGKQYQYRDCYYISTVSTRNLPTINHSNHRKYKIHSEKWVDYNGLIYSLTIKNHMVYTRRNGIPGWTGN